MSPIKKLLSALCIAILLCTLCSFLLNKGLKKYYSEQNNKYEATFLDSTNYDYLFVGSSRVHNNINPKLVDSVTNKKSFNAGTDGANLAESKLIIEAYLENHPAPQKIILGIDLFSFNTVNTLFNYSFYLPFYKNKKIDKTLNLLDHNTSVYKFLPFLQISDYDDYAKIKAVNGLLNKTETKKNQVAFNGFISLGNECLDTNKIIIQQEKMLIDTNGTKYLNDIQSICKQNKIQLMLIYAPEYKTMWQSKVSNAKIIFNTIDSFALKNQISFLRYDANEICENPNYFYNVRHLNTTGSSIFSVIVANDISK